MEELEDYSFEQKTMVATSLEGQPQLLVMLSIIGLYQVIS